MILCLDPLLVLLFFVPPLSSAGVIQLTSAENLTTNALPGTRMFLIVPSNKDEKNSSYSRNYTANHNHHNTSNIGGKHRYENLVNTVTTSANGNTITTSLPTVRKIVPEVANNASQSTFRGVTPTVSKSTMSKAPKNVSWSTNTTTTIKTSTKTKNYTNQDQKESPRVQFAVDEDEPIPSCQSGNWPSFVRIPRAMIMGIPTIVSTMDVSQCADHCRNNTEPTSGAFRLCQGFNYQDISTPTCEFFDNQAQIGPLNRNVGVRSFYFDKICLNDAFESCRQRSYAFESFPDAQLKNNVLKQLTVVDNLACLSACLHEGSFVCHSVNFVKDRSLCELSGFSRRTRPHDFQLDVVGVDYYENNCLTKNTRCHSGDIYFVKTINSEVQPMEATESLTSLHTCLQKCLDSDFVFCRSVEFDRSANECLISDEDSYSAPDILPLANSLGVDLYEPICLSKTSAAHLQCKRPYLFERFVNSALNVDDSFHSLTGIVIEDCLVMCAADVRCRSINYNRKSRLCLLSDQDRSNVTFSLIESPDVDYYENNCNKVSEVRGCLFSVQAQGQVFRSEFRVAELQTKSLTDCLKSCVDVDAEGGHCEAVAFGSKSHLCFHSELSMNAAVHAQKIEPNSDYDIFVREDCYLKEDQSFLTDSNSSSSLAFNSTDDRKFLTIDVEPLDRVQALTASCSFRLETTNRSLRILYRNDQLRADSVASCHLMCQSVTSYECRSFSYSNVTRYCHLSDAEPDTLPMKLLTQTEPGFEFFVRDRCTQSRPALQQKAEPSTETGGVSNSSTLQDATKGIVALTAPPPYGASGSGSDRNSIGSNGSLSIAVSGATNSSQSPTTSSHTGGGSSNVSPGPVRGSMSTLAPQSVQVSAVCSNDGVNVTVASTQPYTGAVYAAERFSFCRNLVTSQNSFWLFLPRPNVNSACNTILVNDQMSGVIVISNDNIIPYDVTTKDDLFYQITCDFSTTSSGGGRVVVTSGLVVGGPTPRVIAAGGSSNYEANLRILRSGAAVKNVLIGEQLTLSIDSNAEPSRMQAVNCNVTRVGGTGPVPEPLTVVENGCPIVPQVIGAIHRSVKGLESSLTAFRIDGSAEIQIVCLLMFCPQDCAPVECPNTDGTSFQSFGRRKRKSDIVLDDIENENVLESVNGRLRVFVEGEDGAPTKEDLARGAIEVSESVISGCVPETTFVAVTAALGILLVMLLTAFVCLMCRRSWMSSLQQKLVNDQMTRMGSRYGDTTIVRETGTRGNNKRLRADILGTSHL